MLEMQVGHFEPDGGLIYLPIGFTPDLFFLAELGGGDTAVKMYWWWGLMEDDEASGAQEGFCVAEGVTDVLADDAGIVAYDSGSQGPTIADWAASTAYTAQTATAHGSYVRATSTGVDNTGAIVDRSAIFECVTAGTSNSTEPVWPSAPGDNSPSDNGVVWQKVDDVATLRVGYKGVRISATPQTDGQEMYYAAWNCGGNAVDWGDVTGWTDGIYGS